MTGAVSFFSVHLLVIEVDIHDGLDRVVNDFGSVRRIHGVQFVGHGYISPFVVLYWPARQGGAAVMRR
jgi:hypothetical protein